MKKQDYDENWYLERTARNHFWLGGKEGQKKVGQMQVAVAGLGGMGSQISELLVRAGVRKIRISDPDEIDISNINRQVIANSDTVGMPKRTALEQKLKQIAPETEIQSFAGVMAENVEQFVDGVDVVVDEIDVFPLKAHLLLHRAARKRKLPIYSGYVVGMGAHFYKFEGEAFKFEDFIGTMTEDELNHPSAAFLLKKFGYPLPKYLNESRTKQYHDEVMTGSIPIFGPATLLGQSLLVTRLLIDFLGEQFIPFASKTPIMPEFVALDPVDGSYQVHNILDSK